MTTTTFNTPRQLSAASSQGTVLGQNAADLVGFHGATPVAQKSSPFQTARTVSAGGHITTYASTQSPSTVLTITTTEKSLTVTGIATTDFIFYNDPSTAVAGLGIGSCRVSAANTLGLTLINPTAGTVTATASAVERIVALSGFPVLTASLSPSPVLTKTAVEQQFTVTGLAAGSLVQVIKPTSQAGIDIVGCRAVADNVVGITFCNVTAATVTPTASESYQILGLMPISAISPILIAGATLTSGPTAVVTSSASEQAIALGSLLTTDSIVGISKPTAQAGLVIGGGRVSAAGSLGVMFGNCTVTSITPTASEVYTTTIYRPVPAAPFITYSVALTPASVAANTCAEQTFTVTGIVASGVVWVNKPSSTPGLGIAGVRASGASTVGINYINTTSAAIVPPPETYLIGQFQMVSPGAGNYIREIAPPFEVSQDLLLNEVRSALVLKGLIKGS